MFGCSLAPYIYEDPSNLTKTQLTDESLCPPLFYKQSIFDPRPKKLFSNCLVDGL